MENTEKDTLQAEQPQPYTRYVRTSANAPLTEVFEHFEYVSNVSETVPEMTVDLRSMIQRRNNGQIVPVHEGGYSEEDFPEVYKMDEVELMQYRLDLAEQMKEMTDELHYASKELERKQEEAKKVASNPDPSPPTDQKQTEV